MGRQVINDTKRSKNPSTNVLATKPINPSADVPATRPKNPSANILPTEGYVLEIDGKLKSEYGTSEAKAGVELKEKYPQTLLSIFDYGVGRHICRCFELTAASRAEPKICDLLLVYIFRPFRNSQHIAAFRAGYPMVGTDGRYRCHGDPLGFIF
jgi:hypothetical protein